MSDKPEITLADVKSKYIKQLGHCGKTNTLGVCFQNGKTFHYSNVTAEMFEALKSAPSIGKHFHQNIRGNSEQYPHKEFTG